MRPRIYISGPLTSSGDVFENLGAAVNAARALIAAGFAPFCPHLSYYLDEAEEIPHRVWMEIDLAWLEVADAVLRLPGESVGADIEVRRAEALGIPVFRSVVDLGWHFRERPDNGRDNPRDEISTGSPSRGERARVVGR
jgi:hypothetical protein